MADDIIASNGSRSRRQRQMIRELWEVHELMGEEWEVYDRFRSQKRAAACARRLVKILGKECVRLVKTTRVVMKGWEE